ncbi:MAG: hypothetical protein ACKOCN_09930 [Planctomycetaceae bacterium]
MTQSSRTSLTLAKILPRFIIGRNAPAVVGLWHLSSNEAITIPAKEERQVAERVAFDTIKREEHGRGIAGEDPKAPLRPGPATNFGDPCLGLILQDQSVVENVVGIRPRLGDRIDSFRQMMIGIDGILFDVSPALFDDLVDLLDDRIHFRLDLALLRPDLAADAGEFSLILLVDGD